MLERLDLGPHGQTERCVEIGERLVEEQELRLLDQGARERHPLLLTARELARPPLEKLPDMHEIGGGPDATEGLLARRLLEAEGEQDVVAHGHMRVERVGLENDPDVSVPGLDLVDDMTVEQKLAGGRKIDAGEQKEARRLAAAGRAEQRDKLAVLDGQVHVGDDFHLPEPLDDVTEFDPRHRRQPFTPPIDICIRYRCAAT